MSPVFLRLHSKRYLMRAVARLLLPLENNFISSLFYLVSSAPLMGVRARVIVPVGMDWRDI